MNLEIFKPIRAWFLLFCILVLEGPKPWSYFHSHGICMSWNLVGSSTSYVLTHGRAGMPLNLGHTDRSHISLFLICMLLSDGSFCLFRFYFNFINIKGYHPLLWWLNHIHMLGRWHGHVLLSLSGSKIAILFFLVSISTLVLLALRHVLFVRRWPITSIARPKRASIHHVHMQRSPPSRGKIYTPPIHLTKYIKFILTSKRTIDTPMTIGILAISLRRMSQTTVMNQMIVQHGQYSHKDHLWQNILTCQEKGSVIEVELVRSDINHYL